MNTLTVLKPVIEGNSIFFHYKYGDKPYFRGVRFPNEVDLSDFNEDGVFQKLVQYANIADTVYLFILGYIDEIKLPYALDEGESQFFEKAFLNGMAEFRFVNDIPIRKPTRITWTENALKIAVETNGAHGLGNNRAFVLNGGGKDGAVAMELVKKLPFEPAWFVSGATSARSRVADLSETPSMMELGRIIDPAINADRIYKGHRPMSFYVSMVGSLAAYVDNRRYVIAANEYSASFANLEKDGFEVNHQYTKSFEYERAHRELFVKQGIPVYYFSITRTLYELQVLSIFSQYPKYHDSFLSCNWGMETDSWCRNCAKCAFVIGAMYLYSPESARQVWGEPLEVFGTNALLDQLIELINPDVKPLDCIGTTAENRYLVRALVDKHLVRMSDVQLQHYVGLMSAGEHIESVDLTKYEREHNFPPELSPEILGVIGDELERVTV